MWRKPMLYKSCPSVTRTSPPTVLVQGPFIFFSLWSSASHEEFSIFSDLVPRRPFKVMPLGGEKPSPLQWFEQPAALQPGRVLCWPSSPGRGARPLLFWCFSSVCKGLWQGNRSVTGKKKKALEELSFGNALCSSQRYKDDSLNTESPPLSSQRRPLVAQSHPTLPEWICFVRDDKKWVSKNNYSVHSKKHPVCQLCIYKSDVSANFCTQNTHTQSSMFSVHFMFFFQQINLLRRGEKMVL